MRIETWLERNITSQIKYTTSPDEVHICCPICNERRYRMYINLQSGLVYCHNCQFKGTIVNLVSRVEHISYTTAKQKFKDFNEYQVPNDLREFLLSKELYATQYKVPKQSVKLPEDYIPLYGSTGVLSQQAINYLHKRGITDNQIKLHNMGLSNSGEYVRRIIIPIYHKNQMVFWVARGFSSKSFPKEKSPHTEFYQYKKSEVIFNLDNAVNDYHEIVLSEGIFDALSWGGIGVALLGKTLYESQLVRILQYRGDIEKVYVALDTDALPSAIKIANQLHQYFNVYLVQIPDGYDDPNNYLVTHSKNDLWKLLDTSIKWEEFTGLKLRLGVNTGTNFR